MRRVYLACGLAALSLLFTACGGGGTVGSLTSTQLGAGTLVIDSGAPTLDGAVRAGGQVIRWTVHSTSTKYDYPIDIYLPDGYGQSSKPLSVIYAADSQYLFQGIVKTVQQYGLNAVVVAVNYVDSNERAVDYLLPGAQAYFRFLTQELIPSVEAAYQVDPKRRTLMGYSYSGVFSVLAMLFDDPANRFFSSIVSIDGSLFVAPSDHAALALTMFNVSRQLPINLLMTCSGSSLSRGNCVAALDLFSWIAKQGFEGVRAMMFTNYSTADHATVVLPSIVSSLKTIYAVAN